MSNNMRLMANLLGKMDRAVKVPLLHGIDSYKEDANNHSFHLVYI